MLNFFHFHFGPSNPTDLKRPRRRYLGWFSVYLVVLAATIVTQAASLHRGPYLQQSTPTSMIVCWRSDQATDGLVRFGTNMTALTRQAAQATITNNHAVTLNDLLPDTRYYYAVGSSGETLAEGDAYFFRTAPMVGSTRSFRVWALGDFGYTNRSAVAVKEGFEAVNGSAYVDLWLMLGDNAYHGGSDSVWQVSVFDTFQSLLRQTPVWSTIGNQETGGGSVLSPSRPYLDVFHFPTQGEAGGVASGTEHYYSFDYGNAHFICLDSMSSDRLNGDPMLNWLEADLAATTNHWTIAFWHHPPYSKGSRNSDTESIQIEMRENAVRMLEQHGVDLVLCGHSHVYERSFLINGHYGLSTTFRTNHVLNAGNGRVDGDGAYHKQTLGPAGHQGAVYVVTGSGSSLGTGPLNHPAMYRSLAEYGSVILDIHANRLEARFIRETGATNDYFTLIKGDVIPRLGAPEIGESTVKLRWSAVADRTYRVQAIAPLREMPWEDVSGPVVAPDITAEWTDLNFGTNRYYRVLSEED